MMHITYVVRVFKEKDSLPISTMRYDADKIGQVTAAHLAHSLACAILESKSEHHKGKHVTVNAVVNFDFVDEINAFSYKFAEEK